tara:strand:+ start:276 stop:509 length:234 start_codon:yes stop_codon:yes gene_type:complete
MFQLHHRYFGPQDTVVVFQRMDFILHRRDLDGTLAQFFQKNQNPNTKNKEDPQITPDSNAKNNPKQSKNNPKKINRE